LLISSVVLPLVSPAYGAYCVVAGGAACNIHSISEIVHSYHMPDGVFYYPYESTDVSDTSAVSVLIYDSTESSHRENIMARMNKIQEHRNHNR
jgi:hypothetical protein